jgi:pimeloyl-ACP methyl ester carboxylesterase
MLKIAALTFLLTGYCISPASAANVSGPWQVAGTPRVIAQPIVFTNAGATLHGTLYRPEQLGPVPAVVALHGASNGSAADPVYDHLREGLPGMGVAVLVFDRRGSGHSTGSLSNIDYQTLADDGIAGARAIAKLPFIDARRIGYWGLSQGGWLAILAAGRDQQTDFVISVSAPLVTPEQQMEFAMSNRLTVLGYSQADVDAMLAARRAWAGYLRGDVPRSDAVRSLAAIDQKPWFPLMYMPSAATLTVNPSMSSVRKEIDLDMLAAVKRVRVPVLFIFGGADPWIPVAQTVARLRRLELTQTNLQDAVIANASHEMMFVRNERMAITATAAPQAPAYFMLMASWLRAMLESPSATPR